ncbi:hypothetical protein SCUP234_03326 [Seiridium cupressi]
MGPRKKTVKRLFSQLKIWQALDVALTAPCCVEIKHSLKNHPRCAQVWIEGTLQAIDISLSLPSDLPLFLLSQLQAQRALANDPRPSVQVCVTLRFATQHLARERDQGNSFPTLFRCRNSGTQRSFCLFAYLDFEMPTYTYTVPELLRLRGSQSSQALLDSVKLNPDLADIIKQNGSTQPRRPKKSKDDLLVSSTDSDEHIVFQGKRQSRLPINNLDGETQWKYRGRTGSERTSSEPIAAPSGLDAQQNEGFQRFFKAVVSPTHVRVTASGRIVPNTRNTTSPTAKWDKDSDTGDLNKSAPPEGGGGQDSGSQQATAAVPPMILPPMPHPMYAGYHPIFAPVGAPMPFYAMPNGIPMPYGLAQPHPPAGSMPQNPAAQGEKQGEESSAATKATGEQEEDKKPRPAPIKISPPEQFDQSRPYFFNGNVFYPGSAPLPMQAHGTPMTAGPYFGGFPAHPASSIAGSFGQQAAMYPMPTPHGFLSPAFAPPQSAGASSSTQKLTQRPPQPTTKLDAAALASAPKPPVTSIKPSQITQSQLASLRSQLKYYEDQLQYNKHQIDEKTTQDQIHMIRKLIVEFEHNYQMQVNFEKSVYQSGEKMVATAGAEANHRKGPSTPTVKENFPDGVMQSGSLRSARRQYPTPNNAQLMDKTRYKIGGISRQRPGINSTKGADTTAALSALETILNKKREEKAKFSLSHAAMAPIFEPRGGTPSLSQDEPSDPVSTADPSLSGDSHWDSSKVLPLSQQGLWPGTNSAEQPLPGDGPEGSENIVRGSTRPYLVGQLPEGLDAEAARANDYTYSRELTEEEKRARHVYWGGVSIKGSGLPKFDGKDFYPASPVKSSERTTVTPSLSIRQIGTGHPPVDYNFEEAKKSDDPFHISRGSESMLTAKNTRKLSHAVPIINPETMTREEVGSTPKAVKSVGTQGNGSTEDVHKSLRVKSQSSPTKTTTPSVGEKKLPADNRRSLDRSSKGSGNDLWQSMMKKAPISGAATPSSVSSTTAKGYLPQFVGHAAASLSPAVNNTNASMRAASGGKDDGSTANHLLKTEKTGENLPPSAMPSTQSDIIADLHERMLRDAERRGVIGPRWP